jgi:hypothetical protein
MVFDNLFAGLKKGVFQVKRVKRHGRGTLGTNPSCS